jgi:hypothetical protein
MVRTAFPGVARLDPIDISESQQWPTLFADAQAAAVGIRISASDCNERWLLQSSELRLTTTPGERGQSLSLSNGV